MLPRLSLPVSMQCYVIVDSMVHALSAEQLQSALRAVKELKAQPRIPLPAEQALMVTVSAATPAEWLMSELRAVREPSLTDTNYHHVQPGCHHHHGNAIASHRTSRMRKKWSRAALHHNGGGLTEGEPSPHAYTEARKSGCKLGRHKAARLLWRSTTGGAAIGEMLHIIKRGRACGEIETAWHRYYGCPRLAAPSDDDFAVSWPRKTDWLKQASTRCTSEPHCLWYRGIVPNGLSVGVCVSPGGLTPFVPVVAGLPTVTSTPMGAVAVPAASQAMPSALEPPQCS